MKQKPVNKNGSATTVPAVNIISEGTTIEGEINSKGDIRIDGELKGVVNSKAKVVIGPTGHVNGNVNCESADIHGRIEGTVKVKDILYLKSTAKADGDIHTAKLVIESGAMFNGNCVMGDRANHSQNGQADESRIAARQRAREVAN